MTKEIIGGVMNEEIKPCPFCGGKCKKEKLPFKSLYVVHHKASCYLIGRSGQTAFWEDDTDGIEAWNKRPDNWISVCEWQDNKDYEYPGWTTSCHEEFFLIEGMPEDNSYNFCPNCGGKIKNE